MAPFLTLAFTLMTAATSMAAAVPSTTPFHLDGQERSIVGGTEAAAGEFPYIVSLARIGKSHFCGGVLINAYTVVTAAHCTVDQKAEELNVRAGSLLWASGGTLVNVTEIKYNADFTATGFSSDIAVWRLATPLAADSTIGYATLPAQGSDPAENLTTTVAGWGLTDEDGAALPPALRKVDVPVISREQCRKEYGAELVTDTMFCAGLSAGGMDSCSGDSGGPIIDKATGILIGLVSWGQGCAEPDYAGVYTRVGALIDWVNANMYTS